MLPTRNMDIKKPPIEASVSPVQDLEERAGAHFNIQIGVLAAHVGFEPLNSTENDVSHVYVQKLGEWDGEVQTYPRRNQKEGEALPLKLQRILDGQHVQRGLGDLVGRGGRPAVAVGVCDGSDG